MSSYQMRSVEQTFKAITSGEGAQIIDVRAFPQFEAEKISGSLFVAFAEIELHAKLLDPKLDTYVMCTAGVSAKTAADRLAAQGFGQLFVVEGGLNAWKHAGLPIEKGTSKVWAIERQVRMAAGLLVLLGVMLGFALHPSFYLLAAFVGAGLSFSAATDTCTMAAVLFKMPWNRA